MSKNKSRKEDKNLTMSTIRQIPSETVALELILTKRLK